MTRFVIYGLLGAVMWGGLIYVATQLAPTQRVYDCRMSEFHPDYPVSVRKQCREVKR